MRAMVAFISALVLSTCCLAQSPLDQIWQKATAPKTTSAARLSNDKITAGLKEALR